MSKHSGGDGGTMKEPGNWHGNKNAPTKPLPKQDDKKKGNDETKKDIIRDDEK